MSATNLLRYGYFAYFSRPTSDRQIYRAAASIRARRLVVVGLGTGERVTRLLQTARRFHPQERISFTGVDWFEGRTAHTPGMTLKQAHRRFRLLAGKVRLLPGDPHSALERAANALVNTDLLLISADVPESSVRRCWYYVPRMLHPASLVLLEDSAVDDTHSKFHRLSPQRVLEFARRPQTELSRAA